MRIVLNLPYMSMSGSALLSATHTESSPAAQGSAAALREAPAQLFAGVSCISRLSNEHHFHLRKMTTIIQTWLFGSCFLKNEVIFLRMLTNLVLLGHSGRHKARGLNPGLHLVLSAHFICPHLLSTPRQRGAPAPYLVQEQLHLYSPKVTFGPLKATLRLLWPPLKMSWTPLFRVSKQLTVFVANAKIQAFK